MRSNNFTIIQKLIQKTITKHHTNEDAVPLGLSLTANQSEAKKWFLEQIENKTCENGVLTGKAGTGKTTTFVYTMKEVIESGKKILLVFPTNRAAKTFRKKAKMVWLDLVKRGVIKKTYGSNIRIEEISNTYHKMYAFERFYNNSANVAFSAPEIPKPALFDNAGILADEVSMWNSKDIVDILKLNSLAGIPMLAVGDSGQILPPQDYLPNMVKAMFSQSNEDGDSYPFTMVEKSYLDSNFNLVKFFEAKFIVPSKSKLFGKNLTFFNNFYRSRIGKVVHFTKVEQYEDHTALFLSFSNQGLKRKRYNAAYGKQSTCENKCLEISKGLFELVNSYDKPYREVPLLFDERFTSNYHKYNPKGKFTFISSLDIIHRQKKGSIPAKGLQIREYQAYSEKTNFTEFMHSLDSDVTDDLHGYVSTSYEMYEYFIKEVCFKLKTNDKLMQDFIDLKIQLPTVICSTNYQVAHQNDFIRTQLFGVEATETGLVKGDQLITNAPIRDGSYTAHHIGDKFSVIEVFPREESEIMGFPTDVQKVKVNYEDSVGDIKTTTLLTLPDTHSMERFKREFERRKSEAAEYSVRSPKDAAVRKALIEEAHEFFEQVAVLGFAYCVSAHKMQGDSCRDVINLASFDGWCHGSPVTQRALNYVAVTRATDLCVSITLSEEELAIEKRKRNERKDAEERQNEATKAYIEKQVKDAEEAKMKALFASLGI